MFKGSKTPCMSVIDDVRIQFDGKSLTIVTPTWRTKAEVTRAWPDHWQPRMKVEVQPLYNVTSDATAPHGLLGQTYDGDELPLHGKRDNYDILDDGFPASARVISGGRVTTRARAEGAIEGEASMYRIRTPFDTNFSFSRFGVDAAAPRNTSALRKKQHTSNE